MILLALTLAPCVAIILYIIYKDKYEKEPLRYLITCFILGCLTIIPAVLLEEYLENFFFVSTDPITTAIHAFFGVALPEELLKFLVLRWYIFRKKDFNEPMDGIVYSVMISMGFATVENIFYVIDSGRGVSTALLRMFTAVPAHAIFGIAMGYYAGKAKFDTWNSRSLLLQGFLVALILHGLYDFFLFQQNFEFLGLLSFVGVALSIRYAKRAIHEHVEASPFKEGVQEEIAPTENNEKTPPPDETPQERNM